MFKEKPKGLPNSISQLQEMVMDLYHQKEEMQKAYELENHLLREKLRLMRLKMFSRISERYQNETDTLQRLLFADFSEDEEESEKDKQEVTVIEEHKRKKPGRKRIPQDLPRVEVVHDIDQEGVQVWLSVACPVKFFDTVLSAASRTSLLFSYLRNSGLQTKYQKIPIYVEAPNTSLHCFSIQT